MPDNTVRYVVRFTGHVQGVGFRFTTTYEARGLNIHGWVRNEPDGSVLVDADGSKNDLEELVRRVKSVMARKIQTTDVRESKSLNRSDGFRISH